MKRIVILLLVLSLVVLSGCGTETAPSEEEVSQPEEVSQEEALDEIDSSLIGDDEEIELGEMI